MSRTDIDGLSKTKYLLRRQEYIGGADAAAILGANPWMSREECYRHKVVGIEDLLFHDEEMSDIGDVKRGVVMEGIVLEMIREEIDETVVAGTHMRHPDYPFIGGTPDGIGRKVYEIKVPRSTTLERTMKEGLSSYWWWQGQHYHLLTGLEVEFVLLDYNAWSLYRIPIDVSAERSEWMIEEYNLFWEHVITHTDPGPAPLIDEKYFAVSNDESLDNLAEKYYFHYKQSKESEAERQRIRGQILSRILNAETVQTANHMIKVGTTRRGNSESRFVQVRRLDN